jgi:phenylacetate-CoA ligase
MMNDIKGFREYNIKQTKLDTIEIDIVADKALSTIQIEKIKSHTEKYLEPNLFIKVNQVDKIEKGVNGKMKHFQSLI